MTYLPVEVLHAIFPLLSQRDQLECMTVCRHWHDIIYNHSLFRVVYIRSDQTFDNLIECIERDPKLGNKVEQLVITLRFRRELKEVDIIKLFPNLREFTLKMPEMWENNKIDRRKKKYPWREHIEKIIEHCDSLHSRILLQAGTCQKLSHLAIKSLRGAEMSNFVKLLVNAPALKTLEFSNCRLTCSKLELLHESAPLLSSLVLVGNTFCRTELPQNIKPATSLKSFKCSNMTFVFRQRNDDNSFSSYLPYISQKYTHLEELILDVNIHKNENENEFVNGEREEDMILAMLGSSLETLSLTTVQRQITLTDYIDLQELDKRGCQIRVLELDSRLDGSALYRLKDSTQVHSIQSISARGLNVYNKSAFKSLEWLKLFTGLKELTLGFYNISQCLVINELLTLLRESQVDTLRLSGMQLSFYDTKPAPVYPFLKDLTLSGIAFPTGLDLFLSQIFPNLKHLELHINLTRKQTLTFPNTDLISLKIKYTQIKVNIPILVVSTKNNQRRVYNYGIYWPSSLDSKDDAMITITCRSVYDFVCQKMEYGSNFVQSRYKRRFWTF